MDAQALRDVLIPPARGFSLVELMVAVALLALLLALAGPSYGIWIANAKTRTLSDTLQNGLRLAQAEAARRHRQVVFFRTTSTACTAAVTASAGGSHWVVRSVPLVAGDPVETIQCGQIVETTDGATVTGPTALCFNGIGRQVANADPGIGGSTCTLPPTGTSAFDISHAQGDRPLRVIVTLAGSVRLCDPARTLSATAPDGCP